MSFPDFPTFLAATNRGRAALPWQDRLAQQVSESGWPDAIGVPTGLGKTTCIDIAVWALASDLAKGAERRAPTRIWYVVNRRLLVDAAHERGAVLARLLAAPHAVHDDWPEANDAHVAAIEAVADALRTVATVGQPLQITRLRGGTELGARASDPAQPAVVFATVPMFASRVLFRGYGSSRSMRPIDAAHAATDAVVLLDEAHLAPRLRRMLDQAAECDFAAGSLLAAARARASLVELTATGRTDVFDLDDDDLAHPIVAERVNATKPTQLVSTNVKRFASEVAELTLGCHADRPNSAVGVFVNTPKTARDVVAALAKLDLPGDVTLLTGRMRAREAEAIRAQILDPEFGCRSGRAPESGQPLTVVATQTLEVGADLDFDFLVTQSAGVRALVQRFGRLNRLGTRPHARGAIVHIDDKQDPVYGVEADEVWARLSELHDVDLAPIRVATVLGPPTDEPGRVGELLPAHLWEFAKTTVPPAGEAPCELFFAGFDDQQARVAVAWRAITERGVPIAPVAATETVELPRYELVSWCQSRNVTEVLRLGSDRATLEAIEPHDVRAGDEVVLPCDLGGYALDGWDPGSTACVLDVSLVRTGVLPLESEPLARFLGRALDPDVADLVRRLATQPDDGGDWTNADERATVAAFLVALANAGGHPWLQPAEWIAFTDRLMLEVQRPLNGVPHLAARPEVHTWGEQLIRADAFDELSFEASSVDLANHLGSVAEQAQRVARALALEEPIVETLRLAGAAHDLGKHDPRFQRWLDPTGASPHPVAKSDLPFAKRESARAASGWPRGGRHELLSARMVKAWIGAGHCRPDLDADLLVHLVISHHAHGRPSMPIVDDDVALDVTVEFEGVTVHIDSRLDDPDWEQPARFRRLNEQYGYWGLALLEAVLRQADHVVSSVAMEVA